MSIRAARANDFWRKAFSRNYSTRYERLGFQRLFCLGNGSIEFRAGISVVVGSNGVGKSTLAAALGELLESEIAERYLGERARLPGSSTEGVLGRDADRKVRCAHGGVGDGREFTGDSFDVESWWLDPGFWAFHTRMQIVKDQNFSDLVEPLTPKSLSVEQLEKISYVVGKKYEHCEIFEIAEYAGFDRFPYFRVRSHGIDYGSEGMGQGELALLLILWVLDDLRSGSILILEEPESHVSPRSQAAMMNLLAEAAATKGIWMIITTHSPTIVSRIPPAHIRLLVRDGATVQVVDRVRRHQVASLLGGGLGYTGVLLVEDEVAKHFLITMLAKEAPDLLRQFEILESGGESKVTAALSSIPKSDGWLRVMGVYDGDQQGLIAKNGLHWPITFLPGNVDPSVLFYDCISGTNGADSLASALNRDRMEIITALDAFVGLDTRDWLIECARAFSLSKAEFVRHVSEVWMQTTVGAEATTRLIESIWRIYDDGSVET
jgi:energy-coupling factor transporter ATP-binding protein EcfA2